MFKKKNVVLASVVAATVSLSTAFAAETLVTTGGTSGTITIEGTVPGNTSFNLFDDVQVFDLTSAVSQGQAGRIVIDSNNPDGFKLRMTSNNGGTLNHATLGGGAATREAPYTLDLVASGSGSLDANVTAPTLTGYDFSTTNPADLNFTCSPVCTLAADSREYNIKVDVPLNASLVSGNYSDDVLFEISDL